MKNVLITGGAGYIGSHTVIELHNAGYTPVIVDNFINSERRVIDHIEAIVGKTIKLYEGDFQDKKLLEKIFVNEEIDGVIHFAAFKAVGESIEKPLAYYQNNVAGLVYLLEAMEDKKVSKLVFSSSCIVYGQPDKLPVTEESPLKPAESPYGATKQMCETVISDTAAASKQLRAIALRYFNPIGAHPSGLIGELPIGTPSNLIPLIAQTAAGISDKLTVFGDDYPTPDGTCIRDYIHVVDLAKAHVKALRYLVDKNPSYYETFNIGTGKGNSVLEVISSFEKVVGQKIPFRKGSRRTGDIVSTYASVSKSKNLLGWEAENSLDDALTDTWRWQNNIRDRGN